ncbi:MAG: rod shape-determining protein MreC [Actinobacteria bacterium]|nr:rod shape-determining protein MreC [Actinomycetota bacterium]MCI0679202.1 rod shape-determining protein MreC [Actinomycetota bacterium]
MLSREPAGRTLPTLITLLVVGVLLMTFDVRSQGAGVVGILRTGTQSLVAPLQKGAAFVVRPVVDLVDSLTNVASLREENLALRAELIELRAELNAMQDLEVRLEFFEQIYEMEAAGSQIGRTVANVIGRPDGLEDSLIIDKGTDHGIAVGQPVVDSNGFVVGSVTTVTSGSATVVPITSKRQGLTVIVGDQEGSLISQPGSELMRLEVYSARGPVLAEERVLTSAGSLSFPAGWPIGVVVEDAAPVVDVVTTTVQPFVNPKTLRLVVVLAWPPDPITAVATTTTTTSSTTTVPGSTTTTGGGG